jgi:hypothetical protein
VFCSAIAETHCNFCLVTCALDFDDNTFAKDCVLNIIANPATVPADVIARRAAARLALSHNPYDEDGGW